MIRLVFNIYIEKIKDKKSANDENNDCDDDAGINEIGGSASKMAGPNAYTNDDPKEVNEDNDSNKKVRTMTPVINVVTMNMKTQKRHAHFFLLQYSSY